MSQTIPKVFCKNTSKYRIELVPWSIIICFYPWVLFGPVSLRVSIACWLCLLLLLFPHLCFVVFVAHRWELLLKDRDRKAADTWGSPSTLPAPEMEGSPATGTNLALLESSRPQLLVLLLDVLLPALQLPHEAVHILSILPHLKL